MALVSFSTSPKYSLNAMALVGHDANPNDGASGASGSNGVSYEAIYSPYRWITLDARYERTNDGLGTIQNNYVGDIALSIMPNLVLTLENVSSVGLPPVTSYQLLWAGPRIRHSVAQVIAAASPIPSAEPPGAANSAAPAPPAGVAAAGKALYATNCTMCHGASGQGGVGPSLGAIGTRKTFDATVAFIEKPAGQMPKLFPDKLTDTQVRDVAAYIRATFH
jgi:mono/diheme cytochrome c family protein